MCQKDGADAKDVHDAVPPAVWVSGELLMLMVLMMQFPPAVWVSEQGLLMLMMRSPFAGWLSEEGGC